MEKKGHKRKEKGTNVTQKEDKFFKNYMSYLVHYEFGLDHRPLKLMNDNELALDKSKAIAEGKLTEKITNPIKAKGLMTRGVA